MTTQDLLQQREAGTPRQGTVLDDVAELARRLLGAPVAGVSLADGDRIRTLATRGVAPLDLPRPAAACAIVLDRGRALELEPDELPAEMAEVLGPTGALRYVGAPVAAGDDACHVGTVWVAYGSDDDVPSDAVDSLGMVARQVGALFDARRDADELARRIGRRDELRVRMAVQNDVLGLIARGAPLHRTLEVIARHMERLEPTVRCSILVVSEDGRTLRDGAAPSFSPAYRAAIDGSPVDAGNGACGRAAATGEVVLTADVTTDPNWVGYRDLARDHGVVACWSLPIFGTDSARPLGTFALYPDRTGSPEPSQLLLARSCAELTAIAIERDGDGRQVRRLRQMFDHIGDAVAAVTSDELRFFYVNRAYEELTGRRTDDLVGRTVGELEDPERARDAWRFVAPLLDGGATTETRDRVFEHVGTGSTRLTEATATRIGDDLIVVYRDVTEQRRAQATLRRSAELFRELSEKAADGIYRVRAEDWSFEYVNPALADMLGHDRTELCTDRTIPARCLAPSGLATLTQARYQGDTRPVDVEWTRPDGCVRTIEVRETPALGDDGRVEAILGVAVDVTRARRLEELQHAFLRAISHELRTPLTSVLGYAATIRSRWRELDAETVEAFLERLDRNANRLRRLLDDLLDVDRLTRSSIEAHRTPTDIMVLATAVADDLSPGTHAITVDGDRFVAAVDLPKVERIVDNLLRNGIRHTPPGTNLHLIVERTDEGVRIVVEDDGPGMSDELKQRAFQPFSQGTTAQGAASPGTGIGLTLVQKFAELHEGSALVEDRAGGGTRFVVDLPADVSGR